MIWQKGFDNLQNEEHSLCELLIIRSLIDLTEYDNEHSWEEFVKKKSDYFEVGLDFIAARLGFHSWRQIFYSEKFEPAFKEDMMLSQVLHNFREKKRKKNKIPKSTSFLSQSNYQLRQEIIDNCITRDILEKIKMKYNIFNISESAKYVIIESKTVDSFDPIRQIRSIIETLFPDPLPSFVSNQERTSQNLSRGDFEKIKNIQSNKCFFCKIAQIQTQDHYIPDHFVHETKPYNIVGACGKCNSKKWDVKPPNRDDFELILKRNEKYPEFFKKDYDKEKYIKEFERFEKITKWKADS